MDSPQHIRDLLVARILAGCVRLSVYRGKSLKRFLLRRPTREQEYIAHEVYAEQFSEASLQGLFNDEDLLSYLKEADLWTAEDEDLMRKLPKEVEDHKVALFKANFKSAQRKIIRTHLNTDKRRLNDLQVKRHSCDHLSCSGVASMARTRYLTACSLRHPNDESVFTDESFWEEASGLLDAILVAAAEVRISEPMFRELARTEPWQAYWSCRKTETSLFGLSVADYTEEQRSLVSYSGLYSNIHEHPDCPSDEIIADDDMLDGWLIEQKREREKRGQKKFGEEGIENQKIRDSKEIYLIADTQEDAQKIMDLNESHARAVQRQRFKMIQEKGVVSEAEMPDTKLNLRMQQTQMMSQAGGK